MPALAAAAALQQRPRSRSRTGPSEGFQRPPEVPFSELAEEFLTEWMPRADPFEGEHMEVAGQTGSGKSYCLATLLHMRALSRDTPSVYICTKKGDATVERLSALGWPIVDNFDDLRKYRQAIYWPRTKLIGAQRKAFYEEHIYNLLARLWVDNANTVIIFDEIGYVESLSQRLKVLIQELWREARSSGIGIVASKQRPVGVSRDQHSESRWKIVFAPAHFADMEAFAELLGRPGDWQPVLESLNREEHQFIMFNSVTQEAFVSWIDFELEHLLLLEQDKRMSPSEKLYGRRNGQKVG